jgi:hypothetical protein
MTDRLSLDDPPGYWHGHSIGLPVARWVHARRVVGMIAIPTDEAAATGRAVRLFGHDGETLDVASIGGLRLVHPTGSDEMRACLALRPEIAENLADIVAWEAAFPAARRIGATIARKGGRTDGR